MECSSTVSLRGIWLALASLSSEVHIHIWFIRSPSFWSLGRVPRVTGAFLLLGICNPDCTVFITVSGAHVKGELGEQAVHLAHPASRWRSGWSCGGIKASVSQRPRCRFMFPFTKVSPFCPPDLAPISLNPLFLLFFSLHFSQCAHRLSPRHFSFNAGFLFFLSCRSEGKSGAPGRWLWCQHWCFEFPIIGVFVLASIPSLEENTSWAGHYPRTHTLPLTAWNGFEPVAKLMFMFLACREGTGMPWEYN